MDLYSVKDELSFKKCLRIGFVNFTGNLSLETEQKIVKLFTSDVSLSV